MCRSATLITKKVEAHAASSGLVILGYYHANERPEDGELGFVARRIADKVHANCPSACALLVRLRCTLRALRWRVCVRACCVWRWLTLTHGAWRAQVDAAKLAAVGSATPQIALRVRCGTRSRKR
jgi:hypothetical protein